MSINTLEELCGLQIILLGFRLGHELVSLCINDFRSYGLYGQGLYPGFLPGKLPDTEDQAVGEAQSGHVL